MQEADIRYSWTEYGSGITRVRQTSIETTGLWTPLRETRYWVKWSLTVTLHVFRTPGDRPLSKLMLGMVKVSDDQEDPYRDRLTTLGCGAIKI